MYFSVAAPSIPLYPRAYCCRLAYHPDSAARLVLVSANTTEIATRGFAAKNELSEGEIIVWDKCFAIHDSDKLKII